MGPPFSVPLFSLQEKLGVLIYTYITNNQTKYRVGIYMYMDNNAVTCLFWLQYWGGGGGGGVFCRARQQILFKSYENELVRVDFRPSWPTCSSINFPLHHLKPEEARIRLFRLLYYDLMICVF